MSGYGTEPGDFVEFDLVAIEAERQRQIAAFLGRAAKRLSAERGASLVPAVVEGEQVLVDEDGEVRYRAEIARDGRLEVTVVLHGDLL